MNKSRMKFFVENMLFYGGLAMLIKALPLITLPIITRLLPNTSSYGMADMFNIITSFGTAIAIMGMYDAIFREFFEDKENIEYQKKVTSTGLNLVIISSTIIMVLIFLFRNTLSELLFKESNQGFLVSVSGISIFFMSISSILASPSRMRNKRKVFLFTGVGLPIVGFLLIVGLIEIGYTYEALIYSTLGVSIISCFVFFMLNKSDFSLRILDKKVMKELFKIGLPLLPTFLIYWVFNSMDRIMINRMLGPEELGIYSVGSKVASVSQLIYTAFAGGWSYFAFSTMKDKDQVKMNSKLFEYLGIISFIAYIVSQPFICPVFKLLFENQYVEGGKVFSFLFLSPLILMLYQVVANQVVIIKKSYLSTVALILGAIVNLILNFILIKKYGIVGAAFSTLISYIVSTIFIVGICKKYKLIILNFKYIIIFGLVILTTIIKLLNVQNSYYIDIIILVIIFFSYYKEIKKLIK